MKKWKIPLAKACLTAEDISVANKVLKSGRLCKGEYSVKAERLISSYIKQEKHIEVESFLYSSGTTALQAILTMVGVEGKIVIIPSFTFVATANAVVLSGGIPVFVDTKIDFERGKILMDLDDLNRVMNSYRSQFHTEIAAIMPVWIYGLDPGMKDIYVAMKSFNIKNKTNIVLLEDSCEAVGAAPSPFAYASVFSGFPNKQIGVGEIGAVTGNFCKSESEYLIKFKNHGRLVTENPDIIGGNYRASEMTSALFYSQFKRIDRIKRKRYSICKLYYDKLKRNKSIKLLPPDCKNSYFSYPIFFKEAGMSILAQQILSQCGIESSKYFYPVHLMSCYRDRIVAQLSKCSVSLNMWESVLIPPMFNDMTKDQVEYVCETINKSFS